MKVLHVLYQSHPNVSGSSTRSRAIIKSQKNIGLTPIVITSPFQVGCDQLNQTEVIDEVKYYRTYINDDSFTLAKTKGFYTRLRKFFSIFRFTKQLYDVAKAENISLIHSHAMFFCAFPAYLVSRLLGVKHVYEIRSDWSVNSNFTANKFTKFILGKLEQLASKLADHLVVISRGLEEKYSTFNQLITIVPNAVDDDVLNVGDMYEVPSKKDTLTMAYIGSVIELEGIEFVLESLKEIDKDKFNFLVVGDGKSLEKLKFMAKSYDLSNVEFLGKISPDSIPNLYKKIDIIINYRRNEPVAHSVTPLKPLEAMAYKKLVITSDVLGMTEIVTDNETGVVIPADSPFLLRDKLEKIHLDFSVYQKVMINGASMVRKDKSWNSNAKLYKAIYSDLVKSSDK
ncbi:glycosyltransferase family 4 protein [Pseudoalteromonas sp. SIMBA_162]|uniref:glycosyltransferase family 4 protein n=1 Tax=Pseudoalteromonas sp. SIMBA_162 TaxID=3080867 RepID=UPI003977EFA3